MKYDNKLNKLINENVDENYAKFHSGLVPNSKIRGVRIPVLRSIAKTFSVYDDFLDNITLNSYESISVACYYIGLTTRDENILIKRAKYILPYVDNWAICDTFVSSLKLLKNQRKEFLPFLIQCLKSENIFTIRFAIVCILNYYLDDVNVNELFEKFLPLQNKDYYIDMAIAWLISVAFVKCKNETLKFLRNKKLNGNVQNLSISKIQDSFRVSDLDKMLVKKLKI